MRTLTGAATAALSSTITKPIFYVELGYSTPLYLCSREGTLWNGITWQATAMAPSTVRVERGGVLAASVTFMNVNEAFSTLVLAQPARGIPMSVWVGDAAATATDDVEDYFVGLTDGAEIAQNGNVTIHGRSAGDSVSHCPRQVIAPPVFNHIPPRGTVITVGTSKYIIE